MAVRAARDELVRCQEAYDRAQAAYYKLRHDDAFAIAHEAELVGFEVDWPYQDDFYHEADITFALCVPGGNDFAIGPLGWYFRNAFGSFLFKENDQNLTDEQVFFLEWSKDWKIELERVWHGYYQDIKTAGELIVYLKGRCNPLSKSANKS